MTSNRWWTTGIPYIDLLYLPYTIMAICYVIIGGLLNPNPNYFNLSIVTVGWFIGVGVVAHSLDEMKGHPLNTGISNKRLLWIAIVGLTLDLFIALYFTIYINWLMLPIFTLLAFLTISYNAELFEGRFHNDMFFVLSFAILPMLVGYWSNDFTIPNFSGLLMIAAISGTAAIETVVNHFVKFNSENFKTAYDRDFAYLQRAVWATVFIVYMITLSLIFKQIL